MVHWHSSESMEEVEDGSAALVVVAPPWFDLDESGYGQWLAPFAREWVRVLSRDGTVVVCKTDPMRRGVEQHHRACVGAVEGLGLRVAEWKVWYRPTYALRRSQITHLVVLRPLTARANPLGPMARDREYRDAVWTMAAPRSASGFADGFPPALSERLVRRHTREGELVVDPFAGEGSVLRAAVLLGRRAVGYEVDEARRGALEGLL